MSAPTRCMKALSALASAFLPSRRLDYRRQRDPAGAVSGRHHPNPQSCPVSWRSTEARVAESAAACCCCLVSYRLIECAMEPTPRTAAAQTSQVLEDFHIRSFTLSYILRTCTAPTPHACDARTSTQTRRSLSTGPRPPQSQSATYTVGDIYICTHRGGPHYKKRLPTRCIPCIPRIPSHTWHCCAEAMHTSARWRSPVAGVAICTVVALQLSDDDSPPVPIMVTRMTDTPFPTASLPIPSHNLPSAHPSPQPHQQRVRQREAFSNY